MPRPTKCLMMMHYTVSHSPPRAWPLARPVRSTRPTRRGAAPVATRWGSRPCSLCVDQADLGSDLRCLPVFLAACNTALCLCGPTYFTRLWCVMELFIFVTMGGSPTHIQLLPLTCKVAGVPPPSIAEASAELRRQIDAFDAAEARCSHAEDRKRLMLVLEAAPGSVDGFNEEARELMRVSLSNSARRHSGEQTPLTSLTPSRRVSTNSSSRRSRRSSRSSVVSAASDADEGLGGSVSASFAAGGSGSRGAAHDSMASASTPTASGQPTPRRASSTRRPAHVLLSPDSPRGPTGSQAPSVRAGHVVRGISPPEAATAAVIMPAGPAQGPSSPAPSPRMLAPSPPLSPLLVTSMSPQASNESAVGVPPMRMLPPALYV